MGVARELREGGTLGRDGGTLGRDGGTLGRDEGTLGRDGGTLGRDGGTLGRDGGTLGRDGGTLGRERGTWRREGMGYGTMERERERSLGRGGSLGRHCDLRGAELVQVAERQLSQIQHVHGYVTHTHITPAQVTTPGFCLCGSGSTSQTSHTYTKNTHVCLPHCPDAVSLFTVLETHTYSQSFKIIIMMRK